MSPATKPYKTLSLLTILTRPLGFRSYVRISLIEKYVVSISTPHDAWVRGECLFPF